MNIITGPSKIQPVLETLRLQLRGHRLSDFAESAAMWADPDVARYILGEPSPADMSWSRMLRHAGHWTLLGFGYWVIEARDDGRFIGEVGFGNFKRQMEPSLRGRPEVGWVLKSSEHGKGFATEAVLRVVQWADEFLPTDETVCIFDPENRASLNVARKAGYLEEAQAVYKDKPTLVMVRPRPGNAQ